MNNRIDKQIDALVGALTDPIIVLDPGWEIPDWLKTRITLERLVQPLKGEEGVATDLEALAYLSNASLVAPMQSDWAEIYMYVFTQEMRRKGTEVPEDLIKEELSPYQMGKLRHLKEWIWRTRVKAREERGRAKRREARASAEAVAPKQLVFPGIKG